MKCEEYRTLNLKTHASKIRTGVIMIIIEKAMDGNLNNNQFGFIKKIGTRKLNLSIRIMIEKQIQQIKETFIVYSGFGKIIR